MTELDVERVKQVTAGICTISDPAPTPEQEIGDIVAGNIDKISAHALSQLRGLRDEIDHLMRAIIEMRDGLKAGVDEQVALASQAIAIKQISAEAVAKLRSSIETGLPQTKRKAITNGKG
jgi:hypothetical protein